MKILRHGMPPKCVSGLNQKRGSLPEDNLDEGADAAFCIIPEL